MDSQSNLIGSTPIPSSLGTTITGAIDTLSGGNTGYELLWTNPYPDNSFPGQQVTFSENNHKFYVIVANHLTGVSKWETCIIEVGYGGVLFGGGGYIDGYSGTPSIMYRWITGSSPTSVTFEGSYTSYQSGTGENSVFQVPYHIYGLF